MRTIVQIIILTAVALVALRAAAAPQGITVIAGQVVVAPGQPAVEPGSTVGIINALCDVNLNLIGCGFMPTAASLACDTNGDGVPELSIPLRDLTLVNRLVVRGRLAALQPHLPGTPFPLACCGGVATLTLSRTLMGSPDNAFGNITQTATCVIDLGLRAPVVISASPSEGDCAIAQHILIPGACFIQPDGSPNVTAVFAVERGNPANTVQAEGFNILTGNLINARFNFGAAGAGRQFLIFVSGPNGVSRNLTALPEGAAADCPLGNEQGVQVTFTCAGSASNSGNTPAPPADAPRVTACALARSPTGAYSLTLTTQAVREGATVSIGGARAKKVKFKQVDAVRGFARKLVLKGGLCQSLPGAIVIQNPDGQLSAPFQCGARCQN